MKKLLFIMRHSAYDGCKAVEILDSVLISAAFDQKVSLLLLDDAVLHLKSNQYGAKALVNIYRSLELYDIDAIYMEQESLFERGLVLDDLQMTVECIPRNQVSDFLYKFELILGE